MKIIDNVSDLFGDDLKAQLAEKSDVFVSAATFSIHAFAALKTSLRKARSFQFIFSGASFVTDHGRERPSHREFMIPPIMNRRDLAGSPFEIRLRNLMTSRALAKDCADWIRTGATFKANPGGPIPPFLCVTGGADHGAVYTGLNGLTTADLGYQAGHLTMITKFTDVAAIDRFRGLFAQLWGERDRLADVTETLCRQLEEVYAENAPARIYHLMLSVIF